MLDIMILECTLALFSFTFCLHWTEYTHVGEKEKIYTTLKHTTKSWNWPYLTSYQIRPIINQFLYLHYSVLSILCACSLSLSPYYFFSTTALLKHEKGSCSAISAIQATGDQGFNQNTISGLAFRGEMSPASEISLPEANTHTHVLSL